MRTTVIAALLLNFATAAAQAHEVWIERDGTGPARIYLGEPAEPTPAGGDPEFAKLTAPRIVAAPAARPVRKAGFLEVMLPPGDVRLIGDSVFAPWGKDGAREGVIYYARAGRLDMKAELPFEIVPLTRNGDRFALVRAGKRVPGARITVIAPDKTSQALTADADGSIGVTTRAPGRYLLTAAHAEKGDLRVAGAAIATLHHIVTTTFVHAP